MLVSVSFAVSMQCEYAIKVLETESYSDAQRYLNSILVCIRDCCLICYRCAMMSSVIDTGSG